MFRFVHAPSNDYLLHFTQFRSTTTTHLDRMLAYFLWNAPLYSLMTCDHIPSSFFASWSKKKTAIRDASFIHLHIRNFLYLFSQSQFWWLKQRERRYKLCKVHSSCVCPWYLISQLGVLDYKDLRVVNHIVHKSLIKCAKSKEKVETQIVYKLVHTSDLKNCRGSQPLAHT